MSAYIVGASSRMTPFAIAAMLAITLSGSVQAQSGTRGGGVDPAAVARYQQYLAQQAAQRQAAQQAAQQRQAAAQKQQQDAARKQAIAEEAERRKGIAVVELFTSQGCSSCPPADKALKQIAEVAKQRGLKVYPLSFHIDYWDRLGWRDPYSQEDFTTRQTAYASKQPGNRIYTPQMIVNGTEEFIGSDKEKAHKYISSALRNRPRTTIELTAGKPGGSTLAVQYELGGNTANKAINIAVVQSPPENDVPRGENAGKKSMHINVVRAFRVVVPEDTKGSVTLELPEDFDRNIPYEVVGYVQDKSSYAITGAAAVQVEKTASPT